MKTYKQAEKALLQWTHQKRVSPLAVIAYILGF